MMRLEWTDNTRQERKALIAYIARDDVDTAKRIDDKLQSAAEGLLIFPRKGQAGRIRGTRDLFVPPRYRLIYKLENDRVIILSVLHTSQKYPLHVPGN